MAVGDKEVGATGWCRGRDDRGGSAGHGARASSHRAAGGDNSRGRTSGHTGQELTHSCPSSPSPQAIYLILDQRSRFKGVALSYLPFISPCPSTRALPPVPFHPCPSTRALPPVPFHPCPSTRALPPVPFHPCPSTRALPPVPFHPCPSTRALPPVPFHPCPSTRALPPVPFHPCPSTRALPPVPFHPCPSTRALPPVPFHPCPSTRALPPVPFHPCPSTRALPRRLQGRLVACLHALLPSNPTQPNLTQRLLLPFTSPGVSCRETVGSAAAFIAPEMLQHSYTHTVDVWSLSCVLFFLLAVVVPFRGAIQCQSQPCARFSPTSLQTLS
ncbi:unnamed protein product [Closterium sp. NIES-65]|nr:unnamed protein product [Closterium sp. NIES-65]